jgi:hypothetical protein
MLQEIQGRVHKRRFEWDEANKNMFTLEEFNGYFVDCQVIKQHSSIICRFE